MCASDKIKDRIRKLLNMAECDAAAEGEIENALRFARQLMDKHHVSTAELTEEQLQEKMALEVATCGGSKMSCWESCLAHAVVETIGTIGWFIGRKVPKRDKHGIMQAGMGMTQQVKFYGPDEDVALAIDMFHTLQKTIATMAKLKWGGIYRGPGRSYCEGFAGNLSDRVSGEVRSERTEECTAIIIRAKDVAKLWLKTEMGINLRSGKGQSRRVTHNHTAFGEGQSDGQKSSLSFTRRAKMNGGSGTTRLLG